MAEDALGVQVLAGALDLGVTGRPRIGAGRGEAAEPELAAGVARDPQPGRAEAGEQLRCVGGGSGWRQVREQGHADERYRVNAGDD